MSKKKTPQRDHRFSAVLVVLVILAFSQQLFTDYLIFSAMLGIATVLVLLIMQRFDFVRIYLVTFAIALGCEYLIYAMGSWNYQTIHVQGQPIWLPFFWFSGAIFVGSVLTLWRMHKKEGILPSLKSS